MRLSTLLLTAMLSASLVACQGTSSGTPQEAVTASVKVAMPSRATMARIAVAYGDIAAGPSSQQTVSFGTEGRVTSLSAVQGEMVRQGQDLGTFQFTPASVIAWRQARSAMDVASQSLSRLQRLRDDHLATDEQVAQANKALSDAQAALTAYPLAMGHDGRVSIRAPASGHIVVLAASVGQLLAANTTLLTVTPDTDQVLLAGAEPRDAARIKPGMMVRMTPVAGGDAITGTVVRAGGAIDNGTRLVPVQIQPAQPLVIGSAWRADITLDDVEGWRAPADALTEDGGQQWLYQLAGGRAYRVKVQVLLERDGEVLLQGAVAPDRPMVVSGNPQLADGMNVAVSGPAQ